MSMALRARPSRPGLEPLVMTVLRSSAGGARRIPGRHSDKRKQGAGFPRVREKNVKREFFRSRPGHALEKLVDSSIMPDSSDRPPEVTRLLQQWTDGDPGAFDRVSAIVYPELRRIAQTYLVRERRGHTLEPPALINEAYLRLRDMGSLRIEGRRQFYAMAAQLMRQILVDHARSVNAQKRGGGSRKVPLDEAIGAPADFAERFLAINEALEELRALNARRAQIIELRHFGGFTLEEAAEHLGMSRASAHREQRVAEAWLARRISG